MGYQPDGQMWCQVGGMPMWVDVRANGGMWGGHWHSGGHTPLSINSLCDFLNSVLCKAEGLFFNSSIGT